MRRVVDPDQCGFPGSCQGPGRAVQGEPNMLRPLAPLVLLVTLLLAPVLPRAAGPTPTSPASPTMAMSHEMPNAIFTLRTGIAQGKMVYLGKGGDIEGKINPTLKVHEGDIVQITLINGEGAEHDLDLPEVHAASQRVTGPGASRTLMFHANDIGTFQYFCTVAGHREAGMQGGIDVEPAAPKEADKGASISHDPADLPPPLVERGRTTVRSDP